MHCVNLKLSMVFNAGQIPGGGRGEGFGCATRSLDKINSLLDPTKLHASVTRIWGSMFKDGISNLNPLGSFVREVDPSTVTTEAFPNTVIKTHIKRCCRNDPSRDAIKV